MRLGLWLRRKYFSRRCGDPFFRGFLQYPVPALSARTNDVRFLVVDLETTALNPDDGEIASIGWVVIEHGQIALVSARHELLPVKGGVGQSAIYHHLHDHELVLGQDEGMVLQHLLEVAKGAVLVFHHAALDMAFLNQLCMRYYRSPLLQPLVDTLRLELRRQQRRELPLEGEFLRLFACRQRYHLPDYPAHNALDDALATAELLLAQIASMGREVVLRDILA